MKHNSKSFQSKMYVVNNNVAGFNKEKYQREARATSIVGQIIILVIILLTAGGLFAQNKNKTKKPNIYKLEAPVTSIVDFKSMMKDNAANFSWACEQSDMPYMLQLQKSQYGYDFVSIVNIPMEDLETRMKFSFSDQQLSKGLFYYRIKKINADDTVEYSAVLKIYSTEQNNDGLGDYYTSAVVTPIKER